MMAQPAQIQLLSPSGTSASETQLPCLGAHIIYFCATTTVTMSNELQTETTRVKPQSWLERVVTQLAIARKWLKSRCA